MSRTQPPTTVPTASPDLARSASRRSPLACVVAIALALGLPLSLTMPSRAANATDRAEAIYASLGQGVAGGVRVHEYRLPNGLSVFISPTPGSGRVRAEVAFRAGARFDPADATGLSHYLEHMLFKGTTALGTTDWDAERPLYEQTRRLYDRMNADPDAAARAEVRGEINDLTVRAAAFAAPNEIAGLLEAWGGRSVGAHTAHDEVVFYAGLPANRLGHWATLEAERFARPVFRLFQPELDIVYQEHNRQRENASAALFQGVVAALWPEHPYGTQTVLGRVEHLRNPTFSRMITFFERHYVPSNAAIIVVGDVAPDAAAATIAQAFADWPAAPAPPEPKGKVVVFDATQRVEIPFPADPVVLMAYHTVAADHPDALALRAVDLLLDSGGRGLVPDGLVQREAIRGGGAYTRQFARAGAQFLFGVPHPDQSLWEVEAALASAVERLRTGAFSDEQLERAVLAYRVDRDRALERGDDRAEALRDAFVLGLNWRDYLDIGAALAAVTRDDVVRVAKRYLDRPAVVGRRVDAPLPGSPVAPPQLDPIPLREGVHSARYRALLGLPAEPIQPRPVRPNADLTVQGWAGGTLAHRAMPRSGVFELRLRTPLGTDHDPRLLAAVRAVTHLSLDAQHDTSAIAPGGADMAVDTEADAAPPTARRRTLGDLFDDRLIRFDAAAGADYTEFELSGPQAAMPEAVNALYRALGGGTLWEDTLGQLIAAGLRSRSRATDNPTLLLRALAAFHRYGSDSPYLSVMTNDALRSLTSGDIVDALGLTVLFDTEAAYSGPASAAEVASMLDAARLLAGPAVPSIGPPAAPPLPQREPVTLAAHRDAQAAAPETAASETAAPAAVPTTVFALQHAEASQARAIIEWIGPRQARPFDPRAELLEAYLVEGMASPLFQQVREKRALAYTVHGEVESPDRPGGPMVLRVSLAASPDRLGEAIAAAIDAMRAPAWSEDRFQTVRRATLDELASGSPTPRGEPSYLLASQRWHQPDDPRAAACRDIANLSLDDLKAFHAQIFSDSPADATIVATPPRISVVGDLPAIGVAELEALGRLSRVNADTILTR